MMLLKRLLQEEDGQGLVEYTLVVVLVALVYWMGVRDTNIGNHLASGWAKVLDCVIRHFRAPPSDLGLLTASRSLGMATRRRRFARAAVLSITRF
jgi:Flp pilus assembly pilin Flp